MTNCETIRCRTRGYNSAYFFIALEKQAFKVLPPSTRTGNKEFRSEVQIEIMRNS